MIVFSSPEPKVSFCDQSLPGMCKLFSLNMSSFHTNVPHKALYQNYVNCSASPNKMATRAKNRKFEIFNDTSLNPWPNFKIISPNVSHKTLYPNCPNSSAPPNKIAARVKNSKNLYIFSRTTGPKSQMFLIRSSPKCPKVPLL